MNEKNKLFLSIYFLLLFVIIISSSFYLLFKVKKEVGKPVSIQRRNLIYQTQMVGRDESRPYIYRRNPIVEESSFVTNRSTGVITGKVIIKDTGAAVKGIKVECVRLNLLKVGDEISDKEIKHSVTNEKGEYVIEGLYDGMYELNVSNAFYTAEPQINVGVYGSIVSSDINFAIVASVSISGRILDSDNGQPLSGISLSIRPLRGNFLFSSRNYKRIITDLSGEITFKELYPTRYVICIDSEEYAYEGNEEGYVIELEEGEVKDVNVYLTKARGGIVGIVNDESGKPLSGVAVYLEKPKREAETNTEGKFKVGNILFKSRDYNLIFRHSGYLSKKYSFRPNKPNDIQEIVAELPPGGTITGNIRSEKGETIEKVKIIATNRGGISNQVQGISQSPSDEYRKIIIPDVFQEEETRKTNSDEFGFYRIKGLEEGKYLVLAIKEGYAITKAEPIEIKSKEAITYDITLYSEKRVKGVIQTSDFKPIGGVDVELEENGYIYKTKTGEDGAFDIYNLSEAGGILKVVRKIAIKNDVVLQTIVRKLSEDESDIQITFSGLATLKGVVTDSVSGQPVEAYNIVLMPLSEENGERNYSKEVKNEKDGSFEFEYLTSGTYFIKVTAQGYEEKTYGAVVIEEDSVVDNIRVSIMPK